MEIVSAADLSRHSGRILADIDRDGAEYVVTFHGRPAVRMMPVVPAGIASAAETDRLGKLLRAEPDWAAEIDVGRADDASTDPWAGP